MACLKLSSSCNVFVALLLFMYYLPLSLCCGCDTLVYAMSVHIQYYIYSNIVANIDIVYIHIYSPPRRGGLVDNTLAYHTGDPGSIPGRGGSSEKCESI